MKLTKEEKKQWKQQVNEYRKDCGEHYWSWKHFCFYCDARECRYTFKNCEECLKDALSEPDYDDDDYDGWDEGFFEDHESYYDEGY